MRIVVAGSRTFTDMELMHTTLSPWLFRSDVTIVHGGAKGADRMAALLALDSGTACEEFPADWGRYGKAAGMIRNKAMVDSGVDRVIVFYGPNPASGCGRRSAGTANTEDYARSKGIPVDAYYEEDLTTT